MKRVVVLLLAALALGAAPALAQPSECSALPSSAQRAHTCNPRQQCLAQVEGKLKGAALESARKDCQRLPTSGTCYGPDTFNPQAECREAKGNKK
ncbi:MAG TPA: hypothetical protein VFL90_12845 [Methylomirabilota bacterium]|nr:hypothetical protein [Methylomirabilota bacterium]